MCEAQSIIVYRACWHSQKGGALQEQNVITPCIIVYKKDEKEKVRLVQLIRSSETWEGIFLRQICWHNIRISLIIKDLFLIRCAMKYGCLVDATSSGTRRLRTRPWIYLAIYSGSRISSLALFSSGFFCFSRMMQKWLLLGPKVVFFYIGRFGLSLMWFLFAQYRCALIVFPDRQVLCSCFLIYCSPKSVVESLKKEQQSSMVKYGLFLSLIIQMS